MKALVGLKRVVDYAVKVRVRTDKSGVDISNVKMSINPFCEIALEESIRLKEKGHISEVIVVSAGPDKCVDTLRQALAMGADRAILLKTGLRTDQELQPLAVAKLIKHIIHREHPMLILMGKQSIDDDSNQCGQMLAGMLGWPQATFISKIDINKESNRLNVEREVDSGLQTLDVRLPAVCTCDLRLNEPRYATLPNLMKAKKKPLEIIDADSLGLDIAPRVDVLSVEEPPKRVGGVKVSTVDELISKLQNEAKVIV